ncbi:MAG: hypothetical protein L0Y71_09755 [Gemmataceae bacterium]|nr:hypothetical protein [Gemmataceae bacterium]
MNLDPTDILRTSRRFYAQHHLADWAEALPATASFADGEAAPSVERSFTHAFAFPPFDVQMAGLDRLIDETARKPAPVPDNQQYVEPFLADHWTKTPNGKVLQSTDDPGPRAWGAYVFVFAPNPVQKCWGMTGKQIREHFQAKDWHGLTVPEYLVLQRFYCEKYGDHRFFEKPEDDSGAHSLWLIDSMDDKNCSVALGSNRGLNLQACSITNRDSKRAAVAGRIVLLQ